MSKEWGVVSPRPRLNKTGVPKTEHLGLHTDQNSFFLKFHVRISTEFGTKHNKFQVKRMSTHLGKKRKHFHTQTNLPFSLGGDEIFFYCESCGTNLGLRSQPKLDRHNDQCLVKISDQNTQGVRRSKSQTETEQNWCSENRTSWLFHPVFFFVICLWTCLLTWVETTYESVCVNFLSTI